MFVSALKQRWLALFTPCLCASLVCTAAILTPRMLLLLQQLLCRT